MNQEPEYTEDDFRKGYGVTWMRALDGAAEEDGAPTRRESSIGAGKQASLGDWAGSSQGGQQDQRESDLYALGELLAERGYELSETERGAFEDMRDRLSAGRYPLTGKQRAWVERSAESHGVDIDQRSHWERNKDVPRGREVPTPTALQNRPLAPPRRRV